MRGPSAVNTACIVDPSVGAAPNAALKAPGKNSSTRSTVTLNGNEIGSAQARPAQNTAIRSASTQAVLFDAASVGGCAIVAAEVPRTGRETPRVTLVRHTDCMAAPFIAPPCKHDTPEAEPSHLAS